MSEKVIKNVYVFGNGMVMTFDQYGQQMPKYQGRYEEVIGSIREVFDGPIVGTDWNSVRAGLGADDLSCKTSLARRESRNERMATD
jgi:hypothetical protein